MDAVDVAAARVVVERGEVAGEDGEQAAALLRRGNERHDEVVARAGERDVEQAQPFGGELRLLALGPVREVRGEEVAGAAGADAEGDALRAGVAERALGAPDVGVQVGEQHDRELEPLRGVDRHQAHDVVALLRDARLGLADLLVLLLVEPAREGAQPAAARDGERARLVGDLEHVRGDLRAAAAISTAAAGERELDEPGGLDRAPHELGQRQAAPLPVQVAQHAERLDDRLGLRRSKRRGSRCARAAATL